MANKLRESVDEYQRQIFTIRRTIQLAKLVDGHTVESLLEVLTQVDLIAEGFNILPQATIDLLDSRVLPSEEHFRIYPMMVFNVKGRDMWFSPKEGHFIVARGIGPDSQFCCDYAELVAVYNNI